MGNLSHVSRTGTAGAPGVLPLLARTVEIDDPGALLALLPEGDQLAWIHRGDGLVGWGRAAEYAFAGPNRFLDAASQWREITRHCVVRDDVELPGSGLVAFGAFTFDDAAEGSRLIIPRSSSDAGTDALG